MNVLEAAGVPVYMFRDEGTVRQAVEDFKAGMLSPASGESVQGGHGEKRRQKTKSGPHSGSRKEEIAALKEEATGLRRRLTSILERIDRLQEGS
jgi:predicted Fe-Mo cluster-binding NifX family protein